VIRNLFETGLGFYHFPFRVIVMLLPADNQAPVHLLISVPKRNFKKAHQRNKVKRVIRESFRLNKHLIIDNISIDDYSLALALIYTAKETPVFSQLHVRMAAMLSHMKDNAVNQLLKNKTSCSTKKISKPHTESTDKPLLIDPVNAEKLSGKSDV